MTIIADRELGDIRLQRVSRATRVSVRVAPDGTLRASAPRGVPLFIIKRFIASSRSELQRLLEATRPTLAIQSGMQIGKSHSLTVQAGPKLRIAKQKLRLVLSVPPGTSLDDSAVQEVVRQEVIAALRREAKSYLPRRLGYLAEQYGFRYEQSRLSHASSRWGSCSSSGTISLNIALMKLPFELIDYVIIHELAHTHHMNHSEAFWQLVGQFDPNYKKHRAALKKETPHI